MADIVLKFPPLCGGPDQGINDAGLETFEGDIPYYIVRECAQNSIDAAVNSEKPVILEFNLISDSVDSMPRLADMRDIFEACRQYHKNDEKAVAFFDKALEQIVSPVIPILKISDYATTGLTGGDFEGKWYGLVHSKGTSIDKSPGAGGSYGIGKNSHIAASDFRTVYYATKTDEGYALRG